MRSLLLLIFTLPLLAQGGQEAITKGHVTIEKADIPNQSKYILSVAPEKKPEAKVLQLLALDLKTKKEKIILLRDDGTFGDAYPDDGVYTGSTYQRPDVERRYYLVEEADDKSHQVLFEYVLLRW